MENMLDKESAANIPAQLAECCGLWKVHLFPSSSFLICKTKKTYLSKSLEILILHTLVFGTVSTGFIKLSVTGRNAKTLPLQNQQYLHCFHSNRCLLTPGQAHSFLFASAQSQTQKTSFLSARSFSVALLPLLHFHYFLQQKPVLRKKQN